MDYSRVFAIEKNSSPIDIFFLLEEFLLYWSIYPSNREYRHLADLVGVTLIRQFSSPTLNAIGNALSISQNWTVCESELNLLDLYTAGNYISVCAVLEADPKIAQKFSIFEIWAKAAARCPAITTTGYIGKLLVACASILRKDIHYEKSTAYLLAQCEAYGALAWFRELHLFVIRETRFISSEINSAIACTASMISTVDSPLKSYALSEAEHPALHRMLRSVRDNHLVVRFFDVISEGCDELSRFPKEVATERTMKFLAFEYLKRGKNSKAVEILENLCHGDDTLISHEASRELVRTFIKVGRAEEAIERYVKSVINNIGLLKTFDNRSVAVACESLLGKKNSISLPIALSLYSRYVDDQYDAALRYAFEIFLEGNEVVHPLSLIDLKIEEDQLLYFLEYVCVPHVMKLYLHFETPREIEEARIAVCKALAERGHKTDAMASEIKERTRQLYVQAATKHVENSRIYADTGAFSRAETSIPYRQLYEKYLLLRKNNYSEAADEQVFLDFATIFESDAIITENVHSLHVQDIALNEKNATFLKLIQLMRDEFTYGERGLSGYLSTRIRHGHLPNTLRKSVSDEGLICSRVLQTGAYRDDAPWLNSICDAIPSIRVETSKIFIDFSVKVNSLIDEVNDSWLQLFTVDQEISGLTSLGKENENLFNYSVTALESFYLQRQLPESPSYNDFVKIIIQWLWERTEKNLSEIRTRVESEVRDRSNRALEELRSEVSHRVGDKANLAEFLDSVSRARVALNVAIDTVVAWFARSRGSVVTQFESNVPVEIARLSSGILIESHEDSTGIIFDGKTLSYFVDIFYVLFENCVTKSGLGREVNVTSKLQLEDNNLVISVENKCNPHVAIEAANLQLQFYRDHYGKEEYSIKAAQGEGGSGLFKVWKALQKDLELRHSIDFRYIGSDSFAVIICVPLTELKKVLYNENSVG